MNCMLCPFRAILDSTPGLSHHSYSEMEPLSGDLHTKFKSQKIKLMAFVIQEARAQSTCSFPAGGPSEHK